MAPQVPLSPALGNLLEGLRFVGDRYGAQLHPNGSLMLTHLIEVAGLLWHVAEVREQQVLLAGLTFRMMSDGVSSEAELQQIFGAKVWQYVAESQDLAALQPQPMQRLRLADEQARRQAACQIRLAEGAVCLRRHPTQYQLPAELAALRGAVPALDAYLDQLADEVKNRP
jgi:(p)ppGpp synthase/HD superfamily hydrolase